MRSRFVSEPQDRNSDLGSDDQGSHFDTNFFPTSLDFATASGNENLAQATSATAQPSDALTLASDNGSANLGDGTLATAFALLNASAGPGHPATGLSEASTPETNLDSGSLNIIGTPAQESGAGLHIAAPIDSGFTATADAWFGSAASAPAPVVLAGLPPASFGIFGVGTITGSGAESAVGVSTSHGGLDVSIPAASTAALAHLKNASPESPITNVGVDPGGATAAQVQQALDESGLSVNGSGIKVGVLSDSFNDLGGAAADEADGALPSTVQVLEDLRGTSGTDEGRAMMQIIHEIAPGASLAFFTADVSEQDFANGIIALANAGAKVIVDDVGYFDEPYFQNGVVAQAIETVEAEGITYVTAAGNEGSNGYQASFTAASGTFDGVTLTNAENFGGSLTQTITINTEGTGADVPLTLEWNQAYGAVSSSTADLELLVFHNGVLVGTPTNTNNQFGNEAGNPWTAYDFTSSGTYQIAIENISSSSTDASLIFKEITWGDGLPATISGANTGTVVGHSLTPGAITAGAVSAADTPAFGFSPTSESFSSSGAGSELLFANNGAALSSPDLLNPVAVSGLDGIATSVSGGLSDFFGTSASSASLAGVAALILSADPNLTPAQVETIMEQTALSMSNPAVSGAGLVRVDPAVAAALALVTHIIQVDGATTLTEIGTNYFLNPTGGGTGPELKQGGAAVTSGSMAPWTPIAAVAVAGGYDIAWHDTSSGLYSVWSLDSNGNYLSNLINPVAGNTPAFETIETTFNLDLNGDGTIGIPTHIIQVDGATTLTEIGTNYFLNPTGGGTGPELKQGGAAVTSGSMAPWTPIAAVAVAGGYDIAWHDTSSGLYSVWSLDSNGNYLSNLINPVAGNTPAFETIETTFNLDLNGDGTIGIPTHIIQVDGATTLTEIGTNYFLNPTGGGTGPELKQGGAAVTSGSMAPWTPIAAVAVAGGYDIAWHDTSSGLYSVWSLDSNGNYLSNLINPVAGNTPAFETIETTFNLDLNGDGTIGIPTHIIQVDGATTLTEIGTNYFLNPTGGGTGPELKQGGAAVTSGSMAPWTPIAAVAVAGGYDIAWHDTSSGLYSVWSLDSNGNYLSNLINPVAGNTPAFETIETTFNLDLNGDGTIGIPTHIIQVDGATTLTEIGTNYFLNPTGGGTGPELKQGGAAVTSGSMAPWTPIAAVAVAGGYDIAWHDTSSGLYSVWSLDSNGNYLSNLINPVAGNTPAFETIETTFNLDLNGDGTIGIPASSRSATSTLTVMEANISADNFRFSNGDNSATGPTPASPGTPSMGQTTASMPDSHAAHAGHDSFVFTPDHGAAGANNFVHATDPMPLNNTAFTAAHAASTETHDDAFANAAIHDGPHGAQWLAHHSEFHIV